MPSYPDFVSGLTYERWGVCGLLVWLLKSLKPFLLAQAECLYCDDFYDVFENAQYVWL